MRNKILVALLLIFGLNANPKAIEFPSGGEITYRSVPGASSKHYIITYTHYELENSSRQDSQVAIGIHSSCDSGGVYMADLISNSPITGTPINPAQRCLSPGSGLSHLYKMWVYELAIILPVHCADWEFYTIGGLRTSSISNLVSPGGKTFLLKASLNSFYQNSSPVIQNKGAREFCANSTGSTLFSQHIIEADNDSVVSYLSQALQGPYPGSPIPIANGYSINSPFIQPSGWNPGSLIFKPINVELVNFKISFDEYRFDTNLNSWLKIGTTSKEIQIQTFGNCSQTAMDLYLLETQIGADCGDTEIYITTSSAIENHSISQDASDFVIYQSDGSTIAIAIASINTWDSGTLNGIKIQLASPLSKNDTLNIVSKMGSDFNTLINYCGYQLPVGDSLRVIVANCNNIGLEESPRISALYPNPVENLLLLDYEGEDGQADITILNSVGQIIMMKKITFQSGAKLKFNISSFPRGIYFLQFQFENNKVENKIFEKL